MWPAVFYLESIIHVPFTASNERIRKMKWSVEDDHSDDDRSSDSQQDRQMVPTVKSDAHGGGREPVLPPSCSLVIDEDSEIEETQPETIDDHPEESHPVTDASVAVEKTTKKKLDWPISNGTSPLIQDEHECLEVEVEAEAVKGTATEKNSWKR